MGANIVLGHLISNCFSFKTLTMQNDGSVQKSNVETDNTVRNKRDNSKRCNKLL